MSTLNKPKNMPHVQGAHGPRERARAKLAQYLASLPDAQVQRLYNDCVALGRQEAANMCIAEANERLTKRNFAKRKFKPVVWQVQMREPMVWETATADVDARAARRRQRFTEKSRRYRARKRQACSRQESVLNTQQVGSPL